MHTNDPVESIVAQALDARGIRYTFGRAHRALDFDLPDYGVKIECKRFFTARIAEQMASHPDVIVIQGIAAAHAFAAMLAR